MHKLNDDQLEIIEDAISHVDGDGEMYSYSGRGMFGRQCLGIDFDSMSDAFRFALLIEDEDLAVMLSQPRFDNMGLGIVIYWPNVEAPEGLDEDEDEDEDALV